MIFVFHLGWNLNKFINSMFSLFDFEKWPFSCHEFSIVGECIMYEHYEIKIRNLSKIDQ